MIRLTTNGCVGRMINGACYAEELRPASVHMAHLDAPSDWRPGGRGFNPAEVGDILSWRLIMKWSAVVQW